MTAAEIIVKAREILQEPTVDYFTAEEFLGWLNDGQLQFCLLSNWLENAFSVNSVKDQVEYDFPATLLKTNFVSYDGIKIFRTSVNELESAVPGWQSADSGTPSYYYFTKKRTFSLYVPPDTAGKIIRILGIVKPTVITLTTETPDIDDAYHEALVNFLLYKAKLKDSAMLEADIFQREFNKYVIQARTEGKFQDRDRKYSFRPK